MGPLEATKPWQTEQVSGVVRFRDKVYALATSPKLVDEMDADVEKAMHKAIKKVTNDIEGMAFNTAISALMVLSNTLQDAGKKGGIPREAVENLALMVSPFAPHLGEECWKVLGHSDSLASHAWVEWDEAKCVDATVTMAVQVNGKVRAKISLAPDAAEDAARELAFAEEGVQKFTEGKDIKKVIYVPGKILNIVAK